MTERTADTAPEAPRELREARQRADALAYQVESTLRTHRARVPEDVRTRAEALIVDTQKALTAEAPRERLQILASRLEELRKLLPAVAGGAGNELRAGGGPDSD